MPFDHFPSEEYRLLGSLKPFLNFKKSSRYPIPIGDDAAIRNCRGNETLVLTADSFIEKIHFSFEYMTAPEVGFKAMAINLSDCAAMGALPDGALVQIIFPQKISAQRFKTTIRGLYRGFNEACRKWDFPVIGGNLAKGPCWIIDITLIGRVEKGSRLLKRNHAKNNDGLWVTGKPGESGAGLACLKKWGASRKIPKKFLHYVEKHIRPVPRIEFGSALSRHPFVHAAIDISDGISKECHTLSYENKLGIVLTIDASDACVSRSLLQLGSLLRRDWHTWFFNGGEDYELLFAASKAFDPSSLIKKYRFTITRIGTFTKSVDGVCVRDHAGSIRPLEKGGWDHLKF
jgi:thiamine-monophosphate kinase